MIRAGTQTGTLALSPMGLQVFAPTGKAIRLPPDTRVLAITDGLIARINVDPGPGTGLGGILAQRGLA